MERFESQLKDQMKHADTVPYPDFERMWSSIRQDELRMAAGGEAAIPRPRSRKRTAIAVSLSVALIATPVYAAVTYDWSNLLSYRAGIQTALEQGLGQTIEQSVTQDGITFTLHTAFTDENRTFLLYSLDPGPARKGKAISFENIGLRDGGGRVIEGNNSYHWNEELKVYQGYFETDWVLNEREADVEFFVENIRFIGDGSQAIDFRPDRTETQTFNIQKDGVGTVTLQSFEQAEGQVLLKSVISFTDPWLQNNSWVRIEAVNAKGERLRESKPSVFGTPEASGEYSNQQIFSAADLRAEGTSFQLKYDRTLGTAAGTWSLRTALSKKQLERSSFKDQLNIPLKEVPGGTKIAEMIVTPTQVRLVLTHEEKYAGVPYTEYQLDVGGKLLEGGLWPVSNEPAQTELRFEMAGLTPEALANEPITLIAKHRVDEHKGDNQPIRLTGISTKRQTASSSIAGYPITWTYYMKDGNLYVESRSSDPAFGGVNQTYYLDGGERNYGKSALIRMLGDEGNENIDVYENFNKTEQDIYIYNYTTNQPEDELRVQVKPRK
ncbi:DUF4179 domain-containing protein [Paenibacillus macerans]|uniref:DUF4179 domain-containing protein n=1 Tax=Paenibacillus macerans TaxID=44252 RepID=UPI0022E5035A|nr:DUF4179 domain-containing protein [Paenibacillus macerans]MEC0139752.1 DUF4179 domain-containing protein [Paenibacillus macerans]